MHCSIDLAIDRSPFSLQVGKMSSLEICLCPWKGKKLQSPGLEQYINKPILGSIKICTIHFKILM